MIIHRLIQHHRQRGADRDFYRLQAQDAIRWIEEQGARLNEGQRVLDLGCGQGIFGEELAGRGCEVTYADEGDWLPAHVSRERFRQINLDTDDPGRLGQFGVVICSNVLEHLAHPARLIGRFRGLLEPGGVVYLSWTNWLSPWGGHDFSPFHYLGPRMGPRVWDRWVKRPRLLKPYENLYPTHIGPTLRRIRREPGLRVRAVAPRYYTELGFLVRLPVVREFLTWNCAVLIERV